MSDESYLRFHSFPPPAFVLLRTFLPSQTFCCYTPTDPDPHLSRRYKVSLRNFYAKHACHPVFFEISRLGARGAKGVHAHIQCVPLPQSLKTEEVEEAFVSQARSQGILFEQDAEEALRLGAGGASYFKVELPDGKKMVHLINPGVPFGIQFGR